MRHAVRILDVESGILTGPNGTKQSLSPTDMALLYWSALGAPLQRIALALAMPTTDVAAAFETLSSRLGFDAQGLAGCRLVLTNGQGPSSQECWERRTATRLITKGLHQTGGAPLVHIAGQGDLSATEVAEIAARIRSGLRRAGIGPGARVAVDATPRIESYLVAVAVLLHGATVIRIGDTVGPAHLSGIAIHVPASAVFSGRLGMLDGAIGNGMRVDLDQAGGHGAPTFEDWLAECPDPESIDHEPAATRPTDPALIGLTSGSTGMPKTVATPHESVWRSTEVAVRLFGMNSDDIFYTASDFTALSAFRSLLTLPLLCGGRVVLPSDEARRSPLASALECEAHGVTRFTVVPNVLRSLVKSSGRSEAFRLARMRTVFSGSGVLDRATADQFRDRFGIPVVDYYGQREIGTALYTTADEPSTVGSGGGFAAEVLVRILDDLTHPVAPGETGEIWVHTDCMMLDPEPPARVGRDPVACSRDADAHRGWFATGDLGRQLANGRIEVVGRKRDIIKTPDGGLVGPQEVEAVLCMSARVVEACVFAMTDTAGVERVAAAVIPTGGSAHDGLDDLETALRRAVADALGSFATPYRILFLTDFPRVGPQKPDKPRLRTLFAEASLGGSSQQPLKPRTEP